MSYISIDYGEGRRQGLKIRAMADACAQLAGTLSAEERGEELTALAAELAAIGEDVVAECDRLLDIEKTMFSAHRGGGNAYV